MPEGRSRIDPLSDVISLLKPQTYVSSGFEIPDDLAIQFPKHEGIKFYALVSGQCWLSAGSEPRAILISAGDCFLLPRGVPFRLAADLSLPIIDAATLRSAGRASTYEGPGNRRVLAAGFTLAGRHAEVLLNLLPTIVHVRQESGKAVTRWALTVMREELRDAQPGSALVAQQLASLLLVQSLRFYLNTPALGGVGWLFALADKQLNAAISAIHDAPAHRWTVAELAQRAGMSRSMFAERFREVAGATPMEYLTRWRMLIAADRMKTTDDSIVEIASSLGYESEGAFRKAFRGVMGCSPRAYGRPSSKALTTTTIDSVSPSDDA